MSQIKELLGKRIKELRVSRKLTQEQLSEMTGIGSPSISKIESGIFHPTDENLEKISQALKVEPYKLYMCSHNKDISELKFEIDNMLKNASESEIRLAYKILSSFLD
ncbi:helix-turn-helix transcriptional regulator [bacterium]|nr:helix-turn-helix transcriptional regulator [bacterium]